VRFLFFTEESPFDNNAIKEGRQPLDLQPRKEREAFTRRAQILRETKSVSLRMTTNPSTGAMIKKKAKRVGEKATRKAAKEKISKKKKETNPAEVRKEISKLVEAGATEMAKAVIADGKTGELATVKYLFHMANIFPSEPDGTQATEEEDCLAKVLLERLKLPVNAQVEEKTEEAAAVAEKVESVGEATEGAAATVANPDIP
jgi:hypothetical protein